MCYNLRKCKKTTFRIREPWDPSTCLPYIYIYIYPCVLVTLLLFYIFCIPYVLSFLYVVVDNLSAFDISKLTIVLPVTLICIYHCLLNGNVNLLSYNYIIIVLCIWLTKWSMVSSKIDEIHKNDRGAWRNGMDIDNWQRCDESHTSYRVISL